MGRQKQEINRDEFLREVEELESKQKFINLSELWNALCKTEWARSLSKPLTPSVAYIRYKEWKLESLIQTKRGKIGRLPGQFPAGPKNDQKRKRRREVKKENVEALKAYFNIQFHKKIEKLAQGSFKAAIALKCLDCCCQQKKEILACQIKACPLHPFRPYQ